ncbi:hypothetical protein VaNZ11_004102, partial [Volvox africanus]
MHLCSGSRLKAVRHPSPYQPLQCRLELVEQLSIHQALVHWSCQKALRHSSAGWSWWNSSAYTRPWCTGVAKRHYATPVPVGAGGTAQHTPGLGALELPKGTTKSGQNDEPPGTQDGRTSQRQKQPAHGEDALMMVLAANAARIHQKEKEIKAARRR